MSKGLEPIHPRDLYDFLVQHGCTFPHQKGSHLNGNAPNGAPVRIPDPGSAHPVTSLCLKSVANSFGKNLHDMRVWLGIANEGKSTVTPKRAARTVKAAPKRPPSVPHTDSIASRIIDTANAVFRSGPCRAVSAGARLELQSIANHLDRWRAQAEQKSA